MKKILLIALLFVTAFANAQEEENSFATDDKTPLAVKYVILDLVTKGVTKDGITTYTLPNGEVVSAPVDDQDKQKELLFVLLAYNTITEICNVPFGSTYEKTIEILKNKYGDYEHLFSSKEDIVYNNKKYAGVDFNNMHFLFQSDGSRSYFNGAVFCIDCKTKSEAIIVKQRLHDILSKKYIRFTNLDKDGNYMSIGGISPVPTADKSNFGVSIDIKDYGKDGLMLGRPYGVRLFYGPYQYVNEEF